MSNLLFTGDIMLDTEKEVTRLLKVLELVRSVVHRELPVQQLMLYLTVLEKPGITMPELVKCCDMPQGTVSRNVKALSHYVVYKDGVAVPHGRNLLRAQAYEMNRHVLAVYPTGRGEALAEEIADLLSTCDEAVKVPRRRRGSGDDVCRHWPRRQVGFR